MRPVGIAGASLLLLASAASSATADEVFLVGGGKIVGEVLERGADTVVVEVGPGRVTLPASRVVRIVSSASALSVYRERAARLGPHDAAGWAALGLWARDNDLATLAGEAFERALAIEPANETAHRALGHVRVGRQWMTEVESYRARGWVQYQGMWMTPQEAQLRAEQDATEAAARIAEREAAAREREAEARARAAEAEAARAAAEAQAAEAGGIPYPWVFGPGYGPYVGYGEVLPPYVPDHRDHGKKHGRRGDDGWKRRDRGRERPPARDDRAQPRSARPAARGGTRAIPDPNRPAS